MEGHRYVALLMVLSQPWTASSCQVCKTGLRGQGTLVMWRGLQLGKVMPGSMWSHIFHQRRQR